LNAEKLTKGKRNKRHETGRGQKLRRKLFETKRRKSGSDLLRKTWTEKLRAPCRMGVSRDAGKRTWNKDCSKTRQIMGDGRLPRKATTLPVKLAWKQGGGELSGKATQVSFNLTTEHTALKVS